MSSISNTSKPTKVREGTKARAKSQRGVTKREAKAEKTAKPVQKSREKKIETGIASSLPVPLREKESRVLPKMAAPDPEREPPSPSLTLVPTPARKPPPQEAADTRREETRSPVPHVSDGGPPEKGEKPPLRVELEKLPKAQQSARSSRRSRPSARGDSARALDPETRRAPKSRKSEKRVLNSRTQSEKSVSRHRAIARSEKITSPVGSPRRLEKKAEIRVRKAESNFEHLKDFENCSLAMRTYETTDEIKPNLIQDKLGEALKHDDDAHIGVRIDKNSGAPRFFIYEGTAELAFQMKSDKKVKTKVKDYMSPKAEEITRCQSQITTIIQRAALASFNTDYCPVEGEKDLDELEGDIERKESQHFSSAQATLSPDIVAVVSATIAGENIGKLSGMKRVSFGAVKLAIRRAEGLLDHHGEVFEENAGRIKSSKADVEFQDLKLVKRRKVGALFPELNDLLPDDLKAREEVSRSSGKRDEKGKEREDDS